MLNLMELKEICLPIHHDVDLLEAKLQENLDSRIPFVKSVAEYVVKNGGKRFRPILTILSSKLSGYQGEAAINLGVAIEFMHTATLLHDDVIDNASLRRGRATINHKWGNHISVLVGDFFYCRAMDILVRNGDLRVLKALTDAITTTTEGEILEITKSNDPSTTEDDYLKIITGKTAALIGGGCQVGGILGKVPEDFEHALRKFGLNVGIAFQLMDDVLDYTASEEDFGKVNGTDLKEGKLTLPLIIALKKATEQEARVIKEALIADQIDPSCLKEVLEIIYRYEGVLETTKLAQNYIQKAKENISVFKPSIEKEALTAIADYVVMRKN